MLFPVVCCNGLQELKMYWNVSQQQDTGHTATRQVLSETDSNTESDEEGDFEVVYGRTCMTRSGKISTKSWLVLLDLRGWCHIDGYTT